MAKETIITNILKEKGITQIQLADKLGITTNNLNNKIQRNNFPMRELVEIADALEMKLMLIPKEEKNTIGYIVDFPDEEKGIWKRSQTGWNEEK